MLSSDILYGAEIIIFHLPSVRRQKQPFTNRHWEKRWLKLFRRCHEHAVRLGRFNMQEAIHFDLINVKKLKKHHMAKTNHQRQQYWSIPHLQPWRMCRNPKTRVQRQNQAEKLQQEIEGWLEGQHLQRAVFFNSIPRVSMMQIICANGTTLSHMFVIQGCRIAHQTIKVAGKEVLETLVDCIPTAAPLGTLREVDSFDTYKVVRWAEKFAEQSTLLR